jgi:hypothetical protein
MHIPGSKRSMSAGRHGVPKSGCQWGSSRLMHESEAWKSDLSGLAIARHGRNSRGYRAFVFNGESTEAALAKRGLPNVVESLIRELEALRSELVFKQELVEVHTRKVAQLERHHQVGSQIREQANQ